MILNAIKMRTTFTLITLLFSISASSQDLATVTIDFSKVLGPEVTACPVLDAASVSYVAPQLPKDLNNDQ